MMHNYQKVLTIDKGKAAELQKKMDELAVDADFSTITKPTACNQSVYKEATAEDVVKLLGN